MNSIGTPHPTPATQPSLPEPAVAESGERPRVYGARPKEGGYNIVDTYEGLADFNDPNFWANANTADLIGFVGPSYELVPSLDGHGYNIRDVANHDFLTDEVHDNRPDVFTFRPALTDRPPAEVPPAEPSHVQAPENPGFSWTDYVPGNGQPWGAGDFNVPAANQVHTVVGAESPAGIDPDREISGAIALWRDGAFRDRNGKPVDSGYVAFPDRGDGQKYSEHVWGTQHVVTADPAEGKVYHLSNSGKPDVVKDSEGVPHLVEHGKLPHPMRWTEAAQQVGIHAGKAAVAVRDGVQAFNTAQQAKDRFIKGEASAEPIVSQLQAASAEAKRAADHTQQIYERLAGAGVIAQDQYQRAMQQIDGARQTVAQIDTDLAQVGTTYQNALAAGASHEQAVQGIWDSIAGRFAQAGSTLNNQLIEGQAASRGLGPTLSATVDQHTQAEVAGAPAKPATTSESIFAKVDFFHPDVVVYGGTIGPSQAELKGGTFILSPSGNPASAENTVMIVAPSPLGPKGTPIRTTAVATASLADVDQGKADAGTSRVGEGFSLQLQRPGGANYGMLFANFQIKTESLAPKSDVVVSGNFGYALSPTGLGGAALARLAGPLSVAGNLLQASTSLINPLVGGGWSVQGHFVDGQLVGIIKGGVEYPATQDLLLNWVAETEETGRRFVQSILPGG